MTYNPNISPSIGYIQATPLEHFAINNINFDIHNDMQTTISSGKTSLSSNAIVIMSLTRDNDGTTTRSSSYQVNASQTDLKYAGRIPSEVSNYMQSSEYSIDYCDNIEPTQITSFGTGNISFTNSSHCRIWRLNT